MAEPALFPYSTRMRGHSRPFSRSRLRDQVGPGTAIYHLLEGLCFADVFWAVDDDFIGSLNTNVWTASNSGGAGVSNFARVSNIPSGAINGDPGSADDADVRLFTTDNELVTARRRPVLLARVGTNTAVATSKWEVGLVDAVGAGAVLLKATPTSTATDYAVIIRDTDDDTNVDLHSDGGTDAAGSVASTSFPAWATQTWYTLVLAVNENRECAFWMNGIFGGLLRSGPDATVTLGAWLYAQNRGASASRTLRADYVKLLAERVPLSGDSFTT